MSGIRYTYGDVKKEVENYDCELISNYYVNCKTMLEFVCKKHRDKGSQFKTFDKIKNRKSCCKYCGRERGIASKRITKDVVINRCNELDLDFIELYTEDGESNVIFTCKKHLHKGNIKVSWDKLRHAAKGCPYCSGRHKTTEDFKQEVLDIFGDKIEILGEYKTCETPIECKCGIDGHIWNPIPSSLRNGSGCPICGERNRRISRTKSHYQFVKEMNEVNSNIEIIGKYTQSTNLVHCRCKLDGHTWESYASNLLNMSAGCPICAKKRVYEQQALSNEQFLNRLKDVNSSIEPQETYISQNKKLKCKCTNHGTIFYQKPVKILQGQNGCRLCRQTKGETILNSLLHSYGFHISIQHTFKDCKNIFCLKFDAFDIENNIAYEYNGEQHYYPVDFAGRGEEWARDQFKINKKRDTIKIEYCKKNDIPLIIIPYWEFDNMEYFLLEKLKELKINLKLH